MERILRRVAGFVFMGLFVLVEVVDSFEVFHRLIPESIKGYITQPIALVVCLVGFVFLYFGFKGESEVPQTVVLTAPPTQPIEIKNEFNPVISPTFNPTININNPPLPQPELLKAPPPLAEKKEQTHNVQFVRAHQHQSNLGAGSKLVAIYENIPIPNQMVRPFNGVKARIEYIDYETRKTVMVVIPAAWADHDTAEVYMKSGEPFLVTLAAFENFKWNAVEISTHGAYWGAMVYEEHFHPLPLGDFIAVVTLIGDHGLSIEPQHFHLRNQADGVAYISHVEPEILS
jgi:hypothetical protein